MPPSPLGSISPSLETLNFDEIKSVFMITTITQNFIKHEPHPLVIYIIQNNLLLALAYSHQYQHQLEY